MTEAVIFLIALAGPCLYAAWSDLKSMTIPNTVVLVCLGLFLLLGPFLMPWEVFLWRFVPALIALVIGFLLSSFGQFGAGDAKFASALLLYVQWIDLSTVLWLYAIIALLSVAALFLLKRAAPAWAQGSGLRALRERRSFPLGLPLAITILAYLALRVQHHLILS